MAPDREAIHYAAACALLFGNSAYVQCEGSADNPALDHDDVYFADLGEPESEIIGLKGSIDYRIFANGIVAANGSRDDFELEIKANGSFLDLMSMKVCEKIFPLPKNIHADGGIAPSGRIFYRIHG